MNLRRVFQNNPLFLGYKFPDLRKPDTIEKRYVGLLSKKALNLMSGMLKIIPEERLTAAEALLHPYFDGIRDPDLENILKRDKISTKNLIRGNIHQEKLMKRLKNKNSLSPHEGGSRERSKPRANRFSDNNSKSRIKIKKENPYKSLSKGRMNNKHKGKPPINFQDNRKIPMEKSSNAVISNK